MWVPIQELKSTSVSKYDYFGLVVDIFDDVLVVGSPYDSDSGAAFVFSERGSNTNAPWVLDQKLVQDLLGNRDRFGTSVSVQSHLIAVGAPMFDLAVEDVGQVLIFSRNEGGSNHWAKVDTLDSPDGGENSSFGYSMALDQFSLVACAATDHPSHSYVGSMNVFRLKFDNSPIVLTPIPNQTADYAEAFEYIVPVKTFSDPDYEESLILSATLSDGSSLDSMWLSFDSITQRFSGVPSATGTVSVLLTATDQDELAVSDSFLINVVSTNGMAASPLEQWKMDHFADPNESTTGDYDADGRSNIEEYVFGSDPDDANDGLENISLIIQEQAGTLTISYIRRTDDPSLSYRIERSVDLMTWVDAGAPVQSDEISLLNGTERVTLVFNTQGTKGFLRVVVEY